MTTTQLVVIVVALSVIAVLSALLGRRHGWSGLTAFKLAGVPLVGLIFMRVFC